MPRHTIGARAGTTQVPLARSYLVTTLRPRDGFSQDGDRLVELGKHVEELELEGQEFLRLAACDGPAAVADFIRGFGPVNLPTFFLDLDTDRWESSAPLARAVAPNSWEAMTSTDYLGEFLSDLWREARLLRAVIDAYRLARKPEELPERVKAWKARKFNPEPDTDLLSPLADSGLRWEYQSRPRGHLALSLAAELETAWGESLDLYPDVVELSADGLLSFVARVLEPSFDSIRLSPAAGQGLIWVGVKPPTLLQTLHMQALQSFAEQQDIQSCGWQRCRGAPYRQRLFLFKTRLTGERDGDAWQWKKRNRFRARRRGDNYCSPECATAASSARQRRTWSDNERAIREEGRLARGGAR